MNIPPARHLPPLTVEVSDDPALTKHDNDLATVTALGLQQVFSADHAERLYRIEQPVLPGYADCYKWIFCVKLRDPDLWFDLRAENAPWRRGGLLGDEMIVPRLIKMWGYVPVTTAPQTNDLVIYGTAETILHVGIMVDKMVVESKWGNLGVYYHALEDVHPEYGNRCLVLRKCW